MVGKAHTKAEGSRIGNFGGKGGREQARRRAKEGLRFYKARACEQAESVRQGATRKEIMMTTDTS